MSLDVQLVDNFTLHCGYEPGVLDYKLKGLAVSFRNLHCIL